MSDLIDRQAVIDLLKQMRKDGDMVPWEGKDVFARIRKLPTIQPEKAQLSQEGTTSDLIDRRAALDIFDDYNVSVENGELEAYSRDRKRLCELPSVQPEPKWVPCRNDLPDIGVTVLFCDVDGDEFIGHRASDYWWSVDDKVKSVIAWMPLPKPFKGGINEIN